MAERDEYESIMLQSPDHGPGLLNKTHAKTGALGSPVGVCRKGWEKHNVLDNKNEGLEFHHVPKDVSRMGVSVLPTSVSPHESRAHFYENAAKAKAQTPTTPRETKEVIYSN